MSLPSPFLTSILGRAVVIGLLWAVWSFFVAKISWRLPPDFTFLIASAGFGLLLGVFLKLVMPSFRWPHVAGILVTWGLAGFLGSYVYSLLFYLSVNSIYRLSSLVAQIVIGLVAGGMTALVIREAQASVTLKQAIVIAAGYVAGAVVSSATFSGPYRYSYLWGLVFGLIGSGVMFWELSQAAAADKAALGQEGARPEQELSGDLISPVVPGSSRSPASMKVILGVCGALIIVVAILWPFRPTRATKLRRQADAGNTYAMKQLAWMHEDGYAGFNKDPQQALSWWRKAAEAGDVGAMDRLASLYTDGNASLGVNKDPQQAFSWRRKAAEAGDVTDMDSVGDAYRNGDGVNKDYQQAVVWYRKAAEAGNVGAIFYLGNMYYYGQGVDKDYKQAASWWRKAAEAGDSSGMANLGLAYENGYGVEKDQQQAISWYSKAAQLGNQFATDQLKRLGVSPQ